VRQIYQHHGPGQRRWVAATLSLTALLYLGAVTGMAYVAGFHAVDRRLIAAHWWWLAPCFASVLLAFVGYLWAYRGIKRVGGGPRLGRLTRLAVVSAGFGSLLMRGGAAVDNLVMRASGVDAREANVRVTALNGFEHGVLAMIVSPAAIVALALGVVSPRRDFSWPWAVIPAIGFVAAIWAAERYRDRLRDGAGWRGRLAIFLDAIHLVYELLRNPRRHGLVVAAMVLYWGADAFALWAAVAAFGVQLSAVAVIVCLGTGMIVTRRTAPLAGAGLMSVAMVPTLWYGAGVPFATATLGVATYHLFTLLVPLPASLLSLPVLRELDERAQRLSPSSMSSTAVGLS
jgi:hypothetical protein